MHHRFWSSWFLGFVSVVAPPTSFGSVDWQPHVGGWDMSRWERFLKIAQWTCSAFSRLLPFSSGRHFQVEPQGARIIYDVDMAFHDRIQSYSDEMTGGFYISPRVRASTVSKGWRCDIIYFSMETHFCLYLWLFDCNMVSKLIIILPWTTIYVVERKKIAETIP